MKPTPITTLLDAIDRRLDDDTTAVDTDRCCRIEITDRREERQPDGSVQQVEEVVHIEVTGIVPRLIVNGEEGIALTMRDRLELACYRWSLKREQRRRNREALRDLADEILPTE